MNLIEIFFLAVYIQFGIGVFTASEYTNKNNWFNLAWTVLFWPIVFGAALTEFLARNDGYDED